MTAALTTVVVVPRERFSHARPSLESILAHTPATPLVYVDGGSPREVREYLAAQARLRGFRLTRTDRYLSPNEARNIGLRLVTTKYVVFIDNDVEVRPGWLEALTGCAEESGAWVVGPLTFVGGFERQIVHIAGGEAEVREENGQTVLHQHQRFEGRPARHVEVPAHWERTGLAEFHCMLVRTDVFARLGPLDEGLMNTREHIDLCLGVSRAGGDICFTPDSVVSYMPPPPLTWSDIPYYMLRWSDGWGQATVQRFEQKWGVHLGEREGVMRRRRSMVLSPLRDVMVRRLGSRRGRWVDQHVVGPAEQRLNRWLVRRAEHKRRRSA